MAGSNDREDKNLKGADETDEKAAPEQDAASVKLGNRNVAVPEDDQQQPPKASTPAAATEEEGEDKDQEKDGTTQAFYQGIPVANVQPVDIQDDDEDEDAVNVQPKAQPSIPVAVGDGTGGFISADDIDTGGETKTVPHAAQKKSGLLARTFNAVASAGISALIGYAIKAAIIPLFGMPAVAGIAVGAVAVTIASTAVKRTFDVMAYNKTHKDDKAGFFDVEKTGHSKKTYYDTAALSLIFAAVGGVIGYQFGDIIADKIGEITDSIFGPDIPDLPDPHAITTAPEAPALPGTSTPPVIHVPEIAAPAPAPEISAPPEILPLPQTGDTADIIIPAPETPVITTPEIMEIVQPETVQPLPPAPDIATDFESGAAGTGPAELTQAQQQAAPTTPALVTVEVAKGDNLWRIVAEHYNLGSNADIQRYVDAVAVANDMGTGTAANTLHIGTELVLPHADSIAGHTDLVLDWKALDAHTAARLNPV